LSTRQLYRSNNQPASYAALTQFAPEPPKEPEERKHHFAVWYIFAAFLGVMLIQYVWLVYTQVETVPYSQFEQLLNENKISEVLVGHDSIQGTLKQPSPTAGSYCTRCGSILRSPTC